MTKQMGEIKAVRGNGNISFTTFSSIESTLRSAGSFSITSILWQSDFKC